MILELSADVWAMVETNEEWVATLISMVDDAKKGMSMGSHKLCGEHEEAIWIPGTRFEAIVDSSRKIAEIVDGKSGTTLAPLDRATVAQLLSAAGAAARAMNGVGPLHAEAGRFIADVSKNRRRADIRDLEGGERIFMLLDVEEVEELHGLSEAILKTMDR
jgi:hypothetical protein